MSAIDDLRTWFMDIHHTSPRYNDILSMSQFADTDNEKNLIARFHYIVESLQNEQYAWRTVMKSEFAKRTNLSLYINNKIIELEEEFDRSASYAIDNNAIRMGYHMVVEELKKILDM